MQSHRKKVQHLMLRAAFGATPKEIDGLEKKSIREIVDQLFSDSKAYKDIHYLPYPLNEREQRKGAKGGKLVELFLKSFAEIQQLNEQWIFKMTYTKAAFREKMVFFWHNHFATSVNFAYLMQEQNNLIRKHALGKFGDLLHAISKDPAMIIYLNNQQNVKDHPNENFARELMELFTLGVGNYTEKDIKEAARAFTGWSVSTTGEFEFKEKKHDYDEKEFFGERKNFSGEDIINKLLKNKQTATFITTKIYKEFVNQEVEAARIAELAEIFFSSDYDIEALMRAIFNAPWFYEDKHIGAKIASPVEQIVRMKKYFDLEFLELKHLINYQKALGQILFDPPNVAGWPGHTTWIDGASLLVRLNTISFIKHDGENLDLSGKPQFEEMFKDKRDKNSNKKLKADWTELLLWSEGKTDLELADAFIQTPASKLDLSLLKAADTKEKLVRLFTFPEFQLI